MSQPTLKTERLLLRPFHLGDAAQVQLLAGDHRIADTTANIPHPYPDGAAAAWISSHAQGYAEKTRMSFAICLANTRQLVGAVSSFAIARQDARAELGYWLGVEYCQAGYCTEAVLGLIQFLQEQNSITKVVGQCFARNTASVRVLQKSGLALEGRLVQHVYKNGRPEDMLIFGRVLPGRV